MLCVFTYVDGVKNAFVMHYRGPDQGHLYPNLEVPGLTCHLLTTFGPLQHHPFALALNLNGLLLIYDTLDEKL